MPPSFRLFQTLEDTKNGVMWEISRAFVVEAEEQTEQELSTYERTFSHTAKGIVLGAKKGLMDLLALRDDTEFFMFQKN